MCRAALCVVGSRFFEAKLAVDSAANFGGVVVFLVVIFPPADRAKIERRGSFKGLVSAAGTPIAHFDRGSHTGMDGEKPLQITNRSAQRLQLIPDRAPACDAFEIGTAMTRICGYLAGARLRGVKDGPGGVSVSLPYTLPLGSTQ